MKVLLINSNRFKQPWPVIPFGLSCIAAAIERERESKVSVLDLCFSRNCAKDIRDMVKSFKPDVIGISIRNIDNAAYNTIFLLDQVRDDIITPCKKAFSGPIIIGGPAAGISGREMLNFFDLEYAIRGDGEACMNEFLRRLKEGASREGLQGLIIRRSGKILQDPAPFYVENLDTLPFPRVYKYLDLGPYKRCDSPLQIQTKRGCGLKCTYCTYNRIEGDHYRFRSPELIADEIETLVKDAKINHVEFTDSAFNVPIDHAKAVLRAVIKKRLNLRLRTMGLNPGYVDEELVALMKESGFTDVDLGAESGCDITLRSLGKNYTKKDLLKAGNLLRTRGISTTWYLLLGAPGETRETLKETFDTITQAASRWDLINIGAGIRVYEGSPIAEGMKRENPNCTRDNFLHPVQYEPNDIGLEEIKKLTKRASFKYPNFFMYDEDETTPTFVLIVMVWVMQLFRINRPVWKVFILLRKVEMFLGIRKLKEFIWEQRGRIA
ncbi:MAG: radical SAM protein [Omnitrophica bacterium]|nr:radical SAM protein [Candidatus Omnitrophota bacterium]